MRTQISHIEARERHEAEFVIEKAKERISGQRNGVPFATLKRIG